MRIRLRVSIFLCLITLAFSWNPPKADTSPADSLSHILSHTLTVQVDPLKRCLKAEDRLEVQVKARGPYSLSFLLNPSLKITRVADLRNGRVLAWTESPFSTMARRVEIPVGRDDEILSLLIAYEGQIYSPVSKERSPRFEKGDETSGLIGQEGVYLSGNTHWYPGKVDAMALFKAEITIPAPYRVVSQGELVLEELKDGFWTTVWSSTIPAESLTLVAGKYSVGTREASGIRVRTYFYEEDKRFSDPFLDAAEEYLKTYSALLGPYPYKKFDVVQNFFASGSSLPTFTLLAPAALRQGKEFFMPGKLDHEIVHSWWGHSVSNKRGAGNWAEALTAYCTNYYAHELKLGREGARKHREDALQKYAIQVPPAADYPLRKFEADRDETDSQIGHGKGSMVFHMLRRIVGREVFFATLREFSRQYGGKQATWKDLQKAFERSSGRDLEEFFSQWLDRAGGPHLRLEKVQVEANSKGYLVTGEVAQVGDVYQLLVPVEIQGSQTGKYLLEISKRRTSFAFEVPAPPRRITLDPDVQLFRRLPPEEVTPCLNASLEDPDKVLVLPGAGSEEQKKRIYEELAGMAREKNGARVLLEKDLTEEIVDRCSLVLFGESWRNPALSKILSRVSGPVQMKEGRVLVEGRPVDELHGSLLVTIRHPIQAGKWVTFYFGSTPGALSRARHIFFYGWDSYVVFEKGRPSRRGNFPPLRSSASQDLVSDKSSSLIAPGSHPARADPEAGTPGG